MENQNIRKTLPAWRLLRRGDDCIVKSSGMQRFGRVTNIIRLSCGKTLVCVNAPDEIPMGIYTIDEVELKDPVARKLNITTYEAMLREYEPKGMSTASASIF